MGKVKTRFLGLEEVEKKQKEEQKFASRRKKQAKEVKKKVHLAGMKGGERTVTVEADQEALAKMEKAKKLAEEGVPAEKEVKKKVKRVTKARVRGKKYQQAKKMIAKAEKMDLEEALTLLKKIKYAKFDEALELHLNTTKAGLKGEVQLPHSLDKTIRVKIVDDKLLDQIEQGRIDFDVLVTHPSYMPKLAKLAKILGPRGLMPNPKTGTISDKPEQVAQKFIKGGMRWKSESKAPIIHLVVGKISATDKTLIENIEAYFKAIGKTNIKSAYLKTTMSPTLQIKV